jgi:N-acetylglucosamine-6-phosphate deacetylase
MIAPPRLSSVPDGWVDLQVNGFAGVDFSAPGLTVADVRQATRALVARGTAAYCATLVSCAPERYEENLPVLASAMDEPDIRPHLLGIHLEGPFLTRDACGAHSADLLQRPSVPLLERWMKRASGRVAILTLAPELDGAEAVIRCAAALGVVVSLGHHLADQDAVARAVDAGAMCSTHLGNGIPNTLPRHPNPIWTQLADDRLTGLFITDGHHLPPEFVRVALRAKGIERFVVTSDAASIAGLPPGEYVWQGKTVVSEPGGRVALKHGTALAGSSATMADCLTWLRSWSGLSETDLRRIGRSNPLRLLGLKDA